MCSTAFAKPCFELLDTFSRKMSYSSSKRNMLRAIHCIIAFSPQDKEDGKINIKKVQNISKKFIKKLTEDNHQYLLVVHLDKRHLHAHILINPVTLRNLSRNNPLFCGHPAKLYDRAKKINNYLTEKYGLVRADKVSFKRKERVEDEKIKKYLEKEQEEIERLIEREIEDIERTDR